MRGLPIYVVRADSGEPQLPTLYWKPGLIVRNLRLGFIQKFVFLFLEHGVGLSRNFYV